MTDLVYLMIAYGIIWGLVLLYLVRLSRRERDLSRQVHALEEALARQQAPQETDTPTNTETE